MDNCLASNSETGGVGCDNMTMSIIAILNGKTKEQWYEEIVKRVANGDGPVAPLEYGEFYDHGQDFVRKAYNRIAEVRGPGVHHNFDDSDSDMLDMDRKDGFSQNSRGRIILLGDGSEVLTNSDDAAMFDQSEENKDLENQVSKDSGKSDKVDMKAANDGKLSENKKDEPSKSS